MGGDDNDEFEYPSPINPSEDYLDARGLALQDNSSSDANVYLTRDASGNLIFRDVIHGAEWKLQQLFKKAGYAAASGQSDTSSTSYQQKLKLTVTTLAGDYSLFWYYELRTGTANKLVQAQTLIDGATVVGDNDYRPTLADLWAPFSGFEKVTLTATSHDFELDWRSNASGYTSSIRKARLLLVATQ